MLVHVSPVTQLFSRLFTSQPASLDSLPNDILVDCVFIHLGVRDILRLRQVNRLYYNLTHHTVIWKRLLSETELPLPPLPPTSRHSLENITGLEAERLLTRAYSLDKIWRSKATELHEKWTFDSHYRIKHMVLLPGSQYLVASASDATRQDWYIVLYVLDSRYNVMPIARTSTKTKGYNLQAKYLTVNGEHGIAISYICRDWKRRGHSTCGINISEYSGDHEIDPPYPVKYECTTLHISLGALESLCEPRFVPGSKAYIQHAASMEPPFRTISYIRSTRQLGMISLDDFAGKPYVTVVRYPNDILTKALNGGPLTAISIRPYPDFQTSPHRIKAMRALPQQQQILVVREVKVTPDRNAWPITGLELQDIPVNNTAADMEVAQDAGDVVFMYDDQFSDVYISEHGTPNWIDDSVQSNLPRGDSPYKPNPISIFCKTVVPSSGLLRLTLYPQRVENSLVPSPNPALRLPLQYHYRYDLQYTSPVRFVECHLNAQYRILPGSHRTLLYTVPWDDITDSPSVLGFFRYHDDELFSDVPEELSAETPESIPLRRPVRRLPFNYEGERFACVAWDETVGRIVFSKPNTMNVMVLDFAKSPKEDFWGRRLPMPVEQDHDADCPTFLDSDRDLYDGSPSL